MEDEQKEPRATLKEIRQPAELRDFTTMLDIDPETRDPEMHYRWAKDSRDDIRRHQLAGYHIVQGDEARPIAGSDDTDDGSQRIGDSVLMAMPEVDYQRRAQKDADLQNARMSAPPKQFMKNARKRGARVLREEDEEE